MTETATREFTPAELAALIADIIRNQEDRWGQGSWFYAPNWGKWDSELYEDVYTPIPVEKVQASLEPGSTCASTACVAGWAAVLTSPPGTVIVDTYHLQLPSRADKTSLERRGQEALDLDRYEADWLFSACRSKAEVLAALDAIAAGEDWDGDEIEDALLRATEDERNEDE
jgi:hypothetical protein